MCVIICLLLWCAFVVFIYCTYFIYDRNPFRDPPSCFYKLIFFFHPTLCVCAFSCIFLFCMYVSITQNSWFHDLPYFQFHCFLMFVCTILTCACTPPNIHIFFILNLQKGKIFFCACVEMRQNSWLQLVLQSFFSYIFILRQKTLLQKLLYPPPSPPSFFLFLSF